MSEQDKEVDVQERWKLRYYESLDELEDKEKSWREVERLLRQLISRLTLAADNRHSILTKQLTELRNAVRDGRDILQMRDLIEEISENVVELDKLRKKDRRQTHPAVLVTQIIEQLDIPAPLNRNFRKLKKDAKNLNRDAAVDLMNDELIAFIRDIINPPVDEKKEARKSKILDRILSRNNKDEIATPEESQKLNEELGNEKPASVSDSTNKNNIDDADPDYDSNKRTPQKLVAPAVGDLLLQLTLRMPDIVKRRINFQALKKHTNRARARRDLIAIVDVIAQQIEAAYIPDEQGTVLLDNDSVQALSAAVKEFFNQLQPPSDMKERVCELEEYYANSDDDLESLIHCLNSLAEVVAEICQRLAFQRDELEGFFVHLSTRLKDLDAGLQKSSEFNELSNESNQKMDLAVHDEIDSIHESIKSEEDISQLKDKISNRLDAIDKHLLLFNENEALRLKSSDAHIKQLLEKISKMEEDGEHLRSRLEETQQLAYRDVLTGIPNRQAYEERIAEEIARCRRYGSRLCMIVWDVDKFKAVNDNYGHAAGDRVLKVVSGILNKQTRGTDFLARFGGEEFVMLLPETDIDATLIVAEKLRVTISETAFHFRDNEVPVTISGGIAELVKDETANSLFERTDKALYEAKENGRNRIELAK
ncbi:diguanylate cyclase/phosphodiesterase (GGDEF & EAL domains) with PAS/PAC sensor(s) [hydrothermal vent metagenome]|uniref:Diguanylate cyclase/phosphodiesterase (GGDEF & EAL domains) with PAS/PAC sensor(S) n=1 Tax=hydrothermal vent metagenome TaxID=652676 RepID=A0A3B0ZRA4_9ZZZZ